MGGYDMGGHDPAQGWVPYQTAGAPLAARRLTMRQRRLVKKVTKATGGLYVSFAEECRARMHPSVTTIVCFLGFLALNFAAAVGIAFMAGGWLAVVFPFSLVLLVVAEMTASPRRIIALTGHGVVVCRFSSVGGGAKVRATEPFEAVLPQLRYALQRTWTGYVRMQVGGETLWITRRRARALLG